MNSMKPIRVHSLTVVLWLTFFLSSAMAETSPLVAVVNQSIHADHTSITVEKIVVYPNEESIAGPGREFYGKSVEMEYGKGPIVIFRIDEDPGYSTELFQPWDWIHVALYSDEKRLSESGAGGLGNDGKTRVVRFSFFALNDEDPMQESVELKDLGQLKLKVTVFKIEKIFDLPFNDLPRGDIPIYEDQNVKIIDSIWTERWDERRQEASTELRVGFNRKVEPASFHLVVKTKGSRYPGSKNNSGGLDHLMFNTQKPKSELASAQFWGIIPVVEKNMTVGKLTPQ